MFVQFYLQYDRVDYFDHQKKSVKRDFWFSKISFETHCFHSPSSAFVYLFKFCLVAILPEGKEPEHLHYAKPFQLLFVY